MFMAVDRNGRLVEMSPFVVQNTQRRPFIGPLFYLVVRRRGKFLPANKSSKDDGVREKITFEGFVIR